MNSVYRLIPLNILQELHEKIYIYAGTCTPSCKNIKLFKEQIKHDIFPIQTDTLWGALVAYNPPKYTVKRYNLSLMSDQELEMKISFLQNSFERFTASTERWGELNDGEKTIARNQYHDELERVYREQTVRLRKKYNAMVLADSIKGYSEI